MEVVEFKYKTYTAYKDSGVEWLGKVPEHWDAKRLGTHFTERKTKVSDKDYKPLSVTKQGILPQLENAAKSNDGDNRKLVKKGDFVINSRSDRKGSSGIANENGSVSLINIVMKPKDFKRGYTNYLLKGYSFIEEFYRNGHGIVADLWTTRYDEMKNIKIPIPPLPEQTAIANFLDNKTAKIDQAIAQKEKLIELLKERKQILIQNAVTKGLDPNAKMKDSGIKSIGRIPQHWQTKKLKYILDSQGRIGFKGYTTSDLVDKSEGALTLGASHMDWDGNIILDNPVYISWKKYYESPEIMVSKGDILIVQRGSTCGKVALIDSELGETTINPSLVLLKNIKELPNYVFEGIKVVLSEILNIVSNTAIPMLSQFQIDNIIIPIPPNEEQVQISSWIISESIKYDKAIALQQKQIEKLKEYKATLIDSAVTGKIKVC
jgi:type I restriction enzyme S subunit